MVTIFVQDILLISFGIAGTVAYFKYSDYVKKKAINIVDKCQLVAREHIETIKNEIKNTL